MRDIGFRYPNRPHLTVVDRVNIDLQAGKTLSLVGPSGSGKTVRMILSPIRLPTYVFYRRFRSC